MLMRIKLNIIAVAVSACLVIACKQQANHIGKIKDASDGTQRLKGLIIHESAGDTITGVIIALDNGCAIRAKAHKKRADQVEFEALQYAGNQISNRIITMRDVTIFFDNNLKSNKNKISPDVLSVHISNKHMPLMLEDTPENSTVNHWKKTYRRG
jgi:hypothetical protein